MNISSSKSIFRFNGFTLDVRRRSLQAEGRDIALSPKEFQTLLLLVNAGGYAVERETIMAAVWPDTAVGDTSLARNISSLRKHLGSDAIEALPKYGYRFALPVSVAALPEESARESGSGHAEEIGSAHLQSATDPAQQLGASVESEPPSIGANANTEMRKMAKTRLMPSAAVTISAALLIAAAVALVEHHLQVTAPTWTDPQTGLTWARRDNGQDIGRLQAIEYCRKLDFAGRHDWRLPTIAELQTLYEPDISIPGTWGQGSPHPRPVYWHIKGTIHPTGGSTASDLAFDTSEEQSYDFSYGRRNFDPSSFRLDHRALCVR